MHPSALPEADSIALALCAHAQAARDLVTFRTGALELLRRAVSFDAALFHELSPRVPLARAAVLGLDLAALAASRASWDALAVQLGRLRDLALEQGGVAGDREAFPPGSRARASYELHVARRFRVRSLLMAHLELDQRLLSAVLLFRRGAQPFRAAEQASLRRLVPVLAVCDAVHQLASARPLRAPSSHVRCVDSRLTSRQRELVERVALGHTNVEIADALGISANTVRNLLVEVRRKLDAANRAELVRVAVLR
jgi:DNA-binding CsgD family transcriptional regulator